LSRIENLKVPPAWDEVRIARSPSAKVQAVGYDSAGRLRHHAEVGENLKKNSGADGFAHVQAGPWLADSTPRGRVPSGPRGGPLLACVGAGKVRLGRGTMGTRRLEEEEQRLTRATPWMDAGYTLRTMAVTELRSSSMEGNSIRSIW
jgi:hypothetical protein